MKVMNEEMRVGMFLVKSVGFRDTCLPFPQRIFSSVSFRLPRISCARNEALLKTIKVANFLCFYSIWLSMHTACYFPRLLS